MEITVRTREQLEEVVITVKSHGHGLDLIVLKGSQTYTIDSCHAVARYCATDDVRIVAVGKNKITAMDNSVVIASGECNVSAIGRSIVFADEQASAEGGGQSVIFARGRSRVHAGGGCTVHACDYAEVWAYGDSRIFADGCCTIHVTQSAVVFNNRGNAKIVFGESEQPHHVGHLAPNIIDDKQHLVLIRTGQQLSTNLPQKNYISTNLPQKNYIQP